MSLEFDATLKGLARNRPGAFPSTFDAPPTLPVSLLNVDLSTITRSADLVFGLGNPVQEILHIDCQSSANARKHADVMLYNALLFHRYLVPVHSILLLLRPQAAHSNQDGTIRYQPRPNRGKMDFGYEVVCLWEMQAEELLKGDLGTAPLAPLGRLSAGTSEEVGLAAIIQRLIERLQKEAPAEQVRELLTAAYILTGLRVRRPVARQLFRGVRGMYDSDTFLEILEEGQLKQAKKDLLRFGRSHLGPADDPVQAAVSALEDLERLDRMLDRVEAVSSWQELLDTP
jgi:hypothetical protein